MPRLTLDCFSSINAEVTSLAGRLDSLEGLTGAFSFMKPPDSRTRRLVIRRISEVNKNKKNTSFVDLNSVLLRKASFVDLSSAHAADVKICWNRVGTCGIVSGHIKIIRVLRTTDG